MNRLKGKIALVTGASKGIGAAIAENMAAEGVSVVVNYASSKAGADAVVNRIAQNGGTAVAVQADVSKPEEIQRLVAEAKRAFGKLDILVNNAGIYEFLAAGVDHGGAFSQAVQPQCARPASDVARGRQAFRS